MYEYRYDITDARLRADAAEGALAPGRHRGPASPEDGGDNAPAAHGRHRRTWGDPLAESAGAAVAQETWPDLI